jgi:hypothetical protein
MTQRKIGQDLSPEVGDVPTIVHSEIPTDDIERPKKFYSNVFGSFLCPSIC